MVEYLQQVPASDPNFPPGALARARAFERRGWSSLAREKLRTVLAGKEVTRENLELWNELARAEEAEGELEAAAAILLKIMAVSVGFRGASDRHEALTRAIEEEKKRSETIRGARIATPGRPKPDGSRYETKAMLGRGGMGAVYKAWDRLLEREVAYKVLTESLSNDPSAREQLLNEARAAAALNHPNIVTVYDLGFEGDEAFICMELVEGETYRAILKKRGRLEIPEALHWLVSVCQGLDHAHQRGIVHRDMKPSNVLLTVDHRVKILDFGLARPAAQGEDTDSWAYSMSGTPKYISPEAIQGRPADARSDVYSVGATLYELLTGRAPFTEGNLLMHHLHTPPPPLRPAREEISPKLEELVLLCLAKAPEERFQSAGEVLSFAQAAKLL
jgi:serine/threonine-protein kinase